MEINSIQSEDEYNKLLGRILVIFDAEPDTTAFYELEKLVTLVENYEKIFYPIPSKINKNASKKF